MNQYPHVATGLKAGQDNTELPTPKEPEPVLPGGGVLTGSVEPAKLPSALSVELRSYTFASDGTPDYSATARTAAHSTIFVENTKFVYFEIPQDLDPGMYKAEVKEGTNVLAIKYVKVLNIKDYYPMIK
jgi:hypothetical protein